MSDFVTVARVSEIPHNHGLTCAVNGFCVVVFHVADEYFALQDECPHMGASLGQGEVQQGHVICDRHLWAYRLSDGECREVPQLRARTFEVRVHHGHIQVRIPLDDKLNASAAEG